MTYPGRRSDPRWQALEARLAIVERRLGLNATAITQANQATTAANTAKRFRVAIKAVGLTLLTPISVDLVWSTPFLAGQENYKVDVNCSALVGMPTVTITNQTLTGCTVSFTPGLAATNAMVIAFAVAPAAS